ncbi:hypothetical protein DXG01_001961 [Tephrocybe rancida]|nr:hypothetical protein DXG01_001961 [Tephrocybe rancida]
MPSNSDAPHDAPASGSTEAGSQHKHKGPGIGGGPQAPGATNPLMQDDLQPTGANVDMPGPTDDATAPPAPPQTNNPPPHAQVPEDVAEPPVPPFDSRLRDAGTGHIFSPQTNPNVDLDNNDGALGDVEDEGFDLKCVRLHLIRLVGEEHLTTPLVAPHEAFAFEQPLDPRGEPTVLCCTAANFRFHLLGTPHHPWNKSAANIFADDALRFYNLERSVRTLRSIVSAFLTRVKSLRAVYMN